MRKPYPAFLLAPLFLLAACSILLLPGCATCTSVPSAPIATTPQPKPPIDLSVSRTSKIKIACVGDSITVGVLTDFKDNYPDQLQRMLADKADVRNFGYSGTTLLVHGDLPYRSNPVYNRALQFNPDIVLIMLGTNDTKPQNWQLKDQFIPDYKDLIAQFAALDSKPLILLARPCVVLGAGRYAITEPILLQELPLIDKVGSDLHLTVVDIHTPTAQAAAAKPELIPDQVHPNSHGATIIAATFYKALTGKDYTGPPTLYQPQ